MPFLFLKDPTHPVPQGVIQVFVDLNLNVLGHIVHIPCLGLCPVVGTVTIPF